MPQTLRTEKTLASKPQTKREYRDDGSVLDDEAVLQHLETDFEPGAGGDPIKGIAIATLIGAATWIALAAALTLLW